jgi:XTP/dITP diphosphohydrolase
MDSISVLLGTGNPAKQSRLRRLLVGLPLNITTPGEPGVVADAPDEQGATHEENARLKAEVWSRTRGTLAISSDGGLVVPALGRRWESLLTRRFAGEEADDEARLECLLRLMRPYRGQEREASWVEALAIARDGRTLASWEVEGATGLLLDEIGSSPVVPGFWVFSIWYFPELGKTYNALDEHELERLNDHWSQLKSLVRQFFQVGKALP